MENKLLLEIKNEKQIKLSVESNSIIVDVESDPKEMLEFIIIQKFNDFEILGWDSISDNKNCFSENIAKTLKTAFDDVFNTNEN